MFVNKETNFRSIMLQLFWSRYLFIYIIATTRVFGDVKSILVNIVYLCNRLNSFLKMIF